MIPIEADFFLGLTQSCGDCIDIAVIRMVKPSGRSTSATSTAAARSSTSGSIPGLSS
jgi:hypothetical protein